MGLTWNLSAAIATGAILAIFFAVFHKAKAKKDSPLYKLVEKLKRKKTNEKYEDETKHYKRLSHRGGVKW